MKYILTTEEGNHYLVDTLTELDYQQCEDGNCSIIRVSDLKQYTNSNIWVDLVKLDNN